jgi:uncharacterized membrane protein
VNTSVTIPAAALAGTYYIIARADAGNVEAETSETNNTRSSSIRIGVDLVVSTLTVPLAPVAPGQVINLAETTRNQGSMSTAGATLTRFYWSTNSTYDTSDVALGERVVGPLDAGANSGPVNTAVTVPSTATGGTYYIIARSDADTTETETSETNNTRYSSVGIGADLIVSTLTGPVTPVAPGQVISLAETTKNQGTAATASTTLTRFYWSTNTTYDTADASLAERSVGALGAGASSGPVNTAVTIPSAAGGTYYIIARADADTSAIETSESNNTRYTTVRIGADLIISTLTGPVAPVSPGQIISLSETTKNQGTGGTAGTTMTRFYWSTNSTHDAADVSLGERSVGPLSTGASSGPVNTPVTIPLGAAAGTYYIIARADADTSATETSETNNTRFITVGIGADLIVPTLVGPTAPVAPGQVISLAETTRNQGSMSTAGTTVTRFYWSTNSIYDAADPSLGERSVGPLSIGASSGPVNTSVTIPSGAAAGIYYIIARADADTSATETSETNNTRFTTVGIGADLIVPTLAGPAAPVTPGQVINIAETTRNQGTDATMGNTVTRFYWSTNSTYDAADVALAERVVGPLGAGASSGPVNTSITIPSNATAGTYYIIARADANTSVIETSEINNTRSSSIGIGIDLVVSTLARPAGSVTPGQAIDIADTTRNQGTEATVGNTVTRFYWSTNSTYDAADIVLGERVVGPLGAGASSGPANTSITIPSNATSGTYYIIARADAGTSVTETSEINNTRSSTVSVSF